MRRIAWLCTIFVMSSCYESDDHSTGDATEEGVSVPDAPPEGRDSDGNGILDADEGIGDPDGDTIPSSEDEDNDGDGIDDVEEIGGTPWDPPDSDGDTVPDHDDLDSDGDSITDRQERPADHDMDEDGVPDRLDLDTDSDGFPDADEAGDADLSTWPIDTDGDMIPDFRDTDSDDDGLPDEWERTHGTSHLDPDSDDDGVPDPVEVVAETDPLDPGSTPMIEGDFFFFLGRREDPVPEMDTLVFPLHAEVSMDVSVMPRADPESPVDLSYLLRRLEVSITGGVSSPTDPSVTCLGGLPVEDVDGDTVHETFGDLPPGTVVCFDIFPQYNDWSWWHMEDNVFRAFIDVLGNGSTTLDTRTAYFFVEDDVYVGTIMLPFIQASW
jgi:hypothetical protein